MVNVSRFWGPPHPLFFSFFFSMAVNSCPPCQKPSICCQGRKSLPSGRSQMSVCQRVPAGQGRVIGGGRKKTKWWAVKQISWRSHILSAWAPWEQHRGTETHQLAPKIKRAVKTPVLWGIFGHMAKLDSRHRRPSHSWPFLPDLQS